MRGRLRARLVCVLLGLPMVAAARAQTADLNAQLIDAAQQGDVAAVEGLLAKGADVNAGNEWGVTPLIFAADRANLPLVTLLLARGANVNAKDLRYGKTPLKVSSVSWGDDRVKDVRAALIDVLLDHGADGGEALTDLVAQGYAAAVRRIVTSGPIPQPYLNAALGRASAVRDAALVEMLTRAGARPPAPGDDPSAPERLTLIAGAYRDGSGGELTLTVDGEDLLLTRPGLPPVILIPLDFTTLRSLNRTVVLTVAPQSGPVADVRLTEGGRSGVFRRPLPH